MNRKNKTIAEALREGKLRLKAAGKEAYAFEAELLLEKAAGLNRTALFLREKDELSEEIDERSVFRDEQKLKIGKSRQND